VYSSLKYHRTRTPDPILTSVIYWHFESVLAIGLYDTAHSSLFSCHSFPVYTSNVHLDLAADARYLLCNISDLVLIEILDLER
jgi:hypothetical protein